MPLISESIILRRFLLPGPFIFSSNSSKFPGSSIKKSIIWATSSKVYLVSFLAIVLECNNFLKTSLREANFELIVDGSPSDVFLICSLKFSAKLAISRLLLCLYYPPAKLMCSFCWIKLAIVFTCLLESLSSSFWTTVPPVSVLTFLVGYDSGIDSSSSSSSRPLLGTFLACCCMEATGSSGSITSDAFSLSA